MTGSRNPDKWVVPGGGVEPTEEIATAAVRELEEEAGARGTITRCLGVFEVSQVLSHDSILVVSSFECHAHYNPFIISEQ